MSDYDMKKQVETNVKFGADLAAHRKNVPELLAELRRQDDPVQAAPFFGLMDGATAILRSLGYSHAEITLRLGGLCAAGPARPEEN